jgi:hypothetical protein
LYERIVIENQRYRIWTYACILIMKINSKYENFVKVFILQSLLMNSVSFKIAKLHASGKVDLAHPTDTQLSVIKEYRNVPFSMHKLAQVGEKSTEEDLTNQPLTKKEEYIQLKLTKFQLIPLGM